MQFGRGRGLALDGGAGGGVVRHAAGGAVRHAAGVRHAGVEHVARCA